MDAFFQAAFCQPPRVLGRQLLPLSLSHVFLLRGLGNRFVTEGDGERTDLFTAVMVCSRTHQDNARRLFGNGGLSVAGMLWWSLRWPESKMPEEKRTFRTYLSDYCTTPERWESGEGKSFRAPWQFHFVHVLTRYYGMNPDDAWNTPVSLARCYYDVWAETEGDESLVSEREKAVIEMVNQ